MKKKIIAILTILLSLPLPLLAKAVNTCPPPSPTATQSGVTSQGWTVHSWLNGGITNFQGAQASLQTGQKVLISCVYDNALLSKYDDTRLPKADQNWKCSSQYAGSGNCVCTSTQVTKCVFN